MEGNKRSERDISSRINKADYDKIIKSINASWPRWKKELCNNELIISTNSVKLDLNI